MDTRLGSSTWYPFDGADAELSLNGANMVFGYSMSVSQGDFYRIEGKFFANEPKRHFLSVAPTRSGKGVSLIIPNLLLYRGSAIVIDPKGENAWITAKYRRDKLKQKTIILDPWGEVNRRYGDLAGEQETIARFNPLSILNPASAHYADDIAYLADALIINQGKDPHWDDSARELVAGLMAYLIEKIGGATLADVRGYLALPADEIRAIAKDALQFGPESVAARKLGRFSLDSKEISSIISTALTQTAFLDSATLAENMQASDFSFEDLINGQATIYLVLPVDKLQTYGRWLRLLVSIGIRTVARNVRPLPLPVLFMLDEFGTIGKLSAVSQAYGLMAGLQMVIWAFVQDINQLKRDYPEDWETFIGNSTAIAFFNVMDNTTARYVSEMCGTTTIERISAATAAKRDGTDSIFSSADPNYMAMADQIFARALIQPAEVRYFTRKYGIMVWGYDPVRFGRLCYHDEPIFLERARIDPHFPEMREAQKNVAANREIPNYEAAKTYLKKLGFNVKEKSFFGSKTKVYDENDTEYIFKQDEDLTAWARKIHARGKKA